MVIVNAYAIAVILCSGGYDREVVIENDGPMQVKLLIEYRDQMVVEQDFFLAASLRARERRVFPGGRFVCPQFTLPAYAHLEPG